MQLSHLARAAATLVLATSPSTVCGREVGFALRGQLDVGLQVDKPDGAWDYRDGGSSWKMGQCCMGAQQSPINVSSATVVRGGSDGGVRLFYHYLTYEAPVTVLNDGHVLAAELSDSNVGGFSLGASYPTEMNEEFELRRIVAHTPSEHTFGGRRVPLELQLVHQRTGAEGSDHSLAVVSVGFVAASQASRFLDSLRQGGLPDRAGDTTIVNTRAPARLDFAELFGRGLETSLAGFWEYEGSLTAPPCNIGVRWFVRAEPLPASAAAMAEFRSAILAAIGLHQQEVGNARELQPACGRRVMARSAEDASTHIPRPPRPAPDPRFEASVEHAGAEQQRLRDALEAAKAPAADAKHAEYLRCVEELAEARRTLATVTRQQRVECRGEAAARTELEESGGGARRAAAVVKHKMQSAQCTSIMEGRLQRLALAQNGIRLRGAKALVTFFQTPAGKNLQYLDLRHNLVTYRGVVELRTQLNMPLDNDSNQGWLLLCDGGERQLLLNAH